MAKPRAGHGDQRIEIIGNTFDSPTTTQGDFAVALTSYKYAVISGNILNGRGLMLYRSTDSAVTGNVFDATYKSGYGVIEVENVADRTVIANNVIASLFGLEYLKAAEHLLRRSKSCARQVLFVNPMLGENEAASAVLGGLETPKAQLFGSVLCFLWVLR